jgi:hypothetical protein
VGLRDRMATVAFPRRRHVSVVGDNGGRHLQHQRGEGQNHLASKLLEGGAHRIGGGRGGGGSNFDGFAGETRTGGRGWRERAQHDFLPWMGRVDEGKRKGRRDRPFKKVAHRCETEGGSAQRQRATMARARRPRAGGCR